MAGMRAVEELLSRAPDRYDITVVGAEVHTNYNRILLSSVLAATRHSTKSSSIRRAGTTSIRFA
jgi:NAD(P)H-nitrite reductase large subunit